MLRNIATATLVLTALFFLSPARLSPAYAEPAQSGDRLLIPVQYPNPYYQYRPPQGYYPPPGYPVQPPPQRATICLTSAGQCVLPLTVAIAVGSSCTCYSAYGALFGVAR
jgi:hypothetical protein